MTKKREISMKPNFTAELTQLPGKQMGIVWEKIQVLVADPFPDGSSKKKLKSQKTPIYRLRSGDYRIFYTFGDTWVCLLGVRDRKDAYEDLGDGMVAEAPLAKPEVEDVDLDSLLVRETVVHQAPIAITIEAKPVASPLPTAITESWLQALHVPQQFFHLLLPCRTEEELLSLILPSDVHDRVIDAMFPPPIESVIAQPTLVAPTIEDFVRYKEGHLLSFLLKLDPTQEKYTQWALKGPTLVKGGAGTGKSTVALYRVKALLEQPGATGKETVLFTTYTRALQAVSRQLLEQLLTPEQFQRVRVDTCDRIARDIVASKRKVPALAETQHRAAALRTARQGYAAKADTGLERKLSLHAVSVIPDKYLLDEFEWIIDGRGLKTREEYQSASRQGRGIAFSAKLRAAVWEIYQTYRAHLKDAGVETWASLRQEALSLVQSGQSAERFDYVLIDEAQDLSPVALALMSELAQSAEGLFFTADNKQSIYSRNYNWSSAHPRLQFKGRTAILELNYRSTAEVDSAAYELLENEDDESMTPSESMLSGPLPVLLRNIPVTEEAAWMVRFIRQMSKHLRMKPHSAAVLVPSNKVGEELAEQMSLEGLPSRFVPGKALDLTTPEVKILTFHSAKGLEFPIVVVGGFRPGNFPAPGEYDNPDEYAEDLRGHRKLLYVAMTRAMRGLMVSHPATLGHAILSELTEGHWSIQEIATHDSLEQVR